jgi:hypothetical protein
MFKLALLSIKIGRSTWGYNKLHLDPLKVLKKSFFETFFFSDFIYFVTVADIFSADAFGVLQHLGMNIKFETFPNLCIPPPYITSYGDSNWPN